MNSLQTFFLQTPILKHSKKTFFLESVFTEVKYSGLQGCSVRETGTVSQRFCVSYKDLGHYFLSVLFPFPALYQKMTPPGATS